MSAQRALGFDGSTGAAGSVGATHAVAGKAELLAASTSSASSSESAKSAQRIRGLSGGGSETEAVVEASDASSSCSTAAQVDRSDMLPAKLTARRPVRSASAACVSASSCAASPTGLGTRILHEQPPTASDGTAAAELSSAGSGAGSWTTTESCRRGGMLVEPTGRSNLSVRHAISNLLSLLPWACTTEAPAFLRHAPAIC
mmetsp:Transcript_44674/g.129224  ORF Transcript_44674/g.129224 Transcript_44674/m.129224 type:complete len:201 (+) Transcript_44674:488-1090(+)